MRHSPLRRTAASTCSALSFGSMREEPGGTSPAIARNSAASGPSARISRTFETYLGCWWSAKTAERCSPIEPADSTEVHRNQPGFRRL